MAIFGKQAEAVTLGSAPVIGDGGTSQQAANKSANRADAQLRALQGSAPTSPSSYASSTMALQQAFGQAQRSGAGAVSEQQMAPIKEGLAQKAAKDASAAEAANQDRRQAINSLALSQQQREQHKILSERQMAVEKMAQDHQQRFSQLNRDMAQQLHDDTTKFKKDEIGRTVLNERQLADYAVLEAKSQEDLQNFAMVRQEMTNRRIQVMQQSYRVIDQALTQLNERINTRKYQEWEMGEMRKDQELQLSLAAAKKAAQDKMDAAKREGAQSAALGGIISAGIGALAVVNPAVGLGAAVLYAGYQASK
jgi:hypothetical protein